MLLDAQPKPPRSSVTHEPEPEPEPEPQQHSQPQAFALETALALSRATVLQPGMVVLHGALTASAQQFLAETAFRRGDAGNLLNFIYSFHLSNFHLFTNDE